MNPTLAFASVAGATVAWLAVPLVPLFKELFSPRDATPLKGVSNGPLGDLVHTRSDAIDDSAMLPAGTEFSFVRARTIVAGAMLITERDTRVAALSSRPVALEKTRELDDRTQRYDGALTLPANQRVEGSLVVVGNLTVGPGAEIRGSLKVHGDVVIGFGARVRGAIVTTSNVSAGQGARITGPVLSEGRVELARDVVIGAHDALSSVCGDRVVLHSGSVVHGSVLARDRGSVL